MDWLEKKENWLPETQKAKAKMRNIKRKPGKKLYTVDEAAKTLNVDKKTIFKWMDFDEGKPESAVIPPWAWFKLPSGYIRIEEWIVLKLLNPA